MRKSSHNYPLARQQRRSPSLPEGLIWSKLRAKAGGVKFRRQHPIGRYVVDFYCAAARCAFEIDGIEHDLGDRPARDEARDGFLTEHGIKVVRIPASEVLADPTGMAEGMARICRGIIAGEI